MGKSNQNTESFERTLFKTADKLRKNIDADIPFEEKIS
jgi:hypothetical protein